MLSENRITAIQILLHPIAQKQMDHIHHFAVQVRLSVRGGLIAACSEHLVKPVLQETHRRNQAYVQTGTLH